MQEDSKNKRRPRPAQMLYVPPAQRNRRSTEKKVDETGKIETSNSQIIVDKKEEVNVDDSNPAKEIETLTVSDISPEEPPPKEKDKALVIMLDNIITTSEKTERDAEQEEMQRAIVNINRKSRPLIKHVNVGKNDVLHINIEKEPKRANKAKLPTTNIDSWEDLLNEDNGSLDGDFNSELLEEKKACDSDLEEEDEDSRSVIRNRNIGDLEHVIELYDFPATFKSQDIMQLYHDVHKDTYIKWCDDTHALLVFSTPAVAKKALSLHNGIIKSRPLGQASAIAALTASKTDLKPAMRRPPTTMQTARRLINTHLGTKSRISKEEQEKEKELLKQAKALKLAQKQSEKDAWEGNPRPSTA